MYQHDEFRVKTQDLREKITEIIRKGNVHRIKIKDSKGKALLNIPVTIAAVGALFAPVLAGITVIASLMTECTIEVERKKDLPKK